MIDLGSIDNHDAEFDPVAYINTPRWRESHYGLERIEALLDLLGKPQDGMHFIHVAGTNGKGSVCSYLSSILVDAGMNTGLFTSPYIFTFEERIRLNGKNISPDDLMQVTLQVRDAATEVESRLGEHPTEFELMTAVAFLYFKIKQCDVAVVEVGLGGRLDSTNVITPDISVITQIGLDHTELLGSTYEAIALEKAGIIKEGVPCVTCNQTPEAAKAIEQVANELNSRLYVANSSKLTIEGFDLKTMKRCFSYKGERYETGLLGSYQPFNASIAIECAKHLPSYYQVSETNIHQGISKAKWPGRFEVVSKHPLVIVDGAHNPQGVAALADSLHDLQDALDLSEGELKVSFVFGVLADKDYMNMIDPILEYANEFYLYPPDNPRALEQSSLAECLPTDIPINTFNTAYEAMAAAVKEKAPEDVIITFGSLYSIADLESAVRNRF